MKTDIYDELFNEVEGLKWLPWVGSDYSENRLLLVGESHYVRDESKKVHFSNKNATVVTVADFVKGHNWNLFENTQYALIGTDKVDRKALWESVAFYNFIQRPMDTPKGIPSRNDFKDGWKVFFELLKILKPSHCIFLGSSGAEYLWPLIEKNNDIAFKKNNCSLEKRDRKIGSCFGKIAHLEFDDVCTDITFIRHPSKYFSKDKWHEYLMEKAGSILVDLQRKAKK